MRDERNIRLFVQIIIAFATRIRYNYSKAIYEGSDGNNSEQ